MSASQSPTNCPYKSSCPVRSAARPFAYKAAIRPEELRSDICRISVLATTGLYWTAAVGFESISIGVYDKGCVVVVTIFDADSRFAIVATAGCQRGTVKRLDALACWTVKAKV